MKITERRIVRQDWHESDESKNGWDSVGWHFDDDYLPMNELHWEVVTNIYTDKFGNPFLGIAEKETIIKE